MKEIIVVYSDKTEEITIILETVTLAEAKGFFIGKDFETKKGGVKTVIDVKEI